MLDDFFTVTVNTVITNPCMYALMYTHMLVGCHEFSTVYTHTVVVNKMLTFRTVSTIIARNVPIWISTVLMYRVRTVFTLGHGTGSGQYSIIVGGTTSYRTVPFK